MVKLTSYCEGDVHLSYQQPFIRRLTYKLKDYTLTQMRTGIAVSLVIHTIFVLIATKLQFKTPTPTPVWVEVGLIEERAGHTPGKAITKEELPELPTVKYTEPPELPEVTPEVREIEKISPPTSPVEGEEGFFITGEIKQRRILYKVIPQYPSGYNEEATVVVKLYVAPSGRIEKMELLQHGGDIFDRLTLNALRLWVFEPLPPDVPQEIQTGTITFIYKLR